MPENEGKNDDIARKQTHLGDIAATQMKAGEIVHKGLLLAPTSNQENRGVKTLPAEDRNEFLIEFKTAEYPTKPGNQVISKNLQEGCIVSQILAEQAAPPHLTKKRAPSKKYQVFTSKMERKVEKYQHKHFCYQQQILQENGTCPSTHPLNKTRLLTFMEMANI